MYNVVDYCRMLTDEVRVNAYANALRQALKPNDVVLDLGAGAGFFSVLACQLGAKKVYAIECNELVALGQSLAAAHQCTDRITFINSRSTQIHLPEQVNVLIADLRGSLPLYAGSAATLIDARQRFLQPAGVLLPLRDTIFAAVIEAPDWYEKNIESLIAPRHAIDQTVFRKILCNQFYKCRLTENALLTAPQIWATLEYYTMETSDFAATLRWQAQRTGIAHGISLWFEAEINAAERFSTAPFLPERVYGNPFLALENPVALTRGDEIIVQLAATLIDEEYVWRWDTKILDAKGNVRIDFNQSTFLSTIISPQNIRKQTATFIPSLQEEGVVNAYILSQMNGQNSIQTIAENLSGRFPDWFATWQQAMKPVGALAKKFSL